MDYTKKIMYQSNSWYNDGLRKAQVRDMSGAIVSPLPQNGTYLIRVQR